MRRKPSVVQVVKVMGEEYSIFSMSKGEHVVVGLMTESRFNNGPDIPAFRS
jgi:hypothetical protein